MSLFDEVALEWDLRARNALAGVGRRLYQRGYLCATTFHRSGPQAIGIQLELQAKGRTEAGPVLEVYLGDPKEALLPGDGVLSMAVVYDAKGRRLSRAPAPGASASTLVRKDKKSFEQALDSWLDEGFLYQFVVTTLDLPLIENAGFNAAP